MKQRRNTAHGFKAVDPEILLSGSDKKKLKTQLKSCFSSLTEEDLNNLLPTKEEVIARERY